MDCHEHSGFEARVKGAEEQCKETKEGLRRVHERIDDLTEAMNNMKIEFMDKLKSYSEQMTRQYEETTKLIMDPQNGIASGLDKRISKNEETLRWTFRILQWAGIGAAAVLSLFRDKVSEIMKWYINL